MASDTSYTNRRQNTQRLLAEIKLQRSEQDAERPPWECGWRSGVPGYYLFEGEGITDKKLYQLLVMQSTAHTIWLGQYRPADKRMRDVIRHRRFCGTLLLKIALSIGWTEEEADVLIHVWNYQHEFEYHDVQLKELLNDAMAATQDRRDARAKAKEDKMKDKTGYQVLDLIDVLGPNTPAGVARELGVPPGSNAQRWRETVKKSMQRLAKVGGLESLGNGVYGLVSEDSSGDKTGTKEVRDKLNEKLKASLSVTSFVPVLSPSPSITKVVTLPVTPLDPQEQYLHQMMEDGYLDMTPQG